MKSQQINKTSSLIDVIEVLSGLWNEYKKDDFHIVVTPFFTTLTATLNKGLHIFPFNLYTPIGGILYCSDNSIYSIIVKPNETAINLPKSGIIQFILFGEQAKLR